MTVSLYTQIVFKIFIINVNNSTINSDIFNREKMRKRVVLGKFSYKKNQLNMNETTMKKSRNILSTTSAVL